MTVEDVVARLDATSQALSRAGEILGALPVQPSMLGEVLRQFDDEREPVPAAALTLWNVLVRGRAISGQVLTVGCSADVVRFLARGHAVLDAARDIHCINVPESIDPEPRGEGSPVCVPHRGEPGLIIRELTVPTFALVVLRLTNARQLLGCLSLASARLSRRGSILVLDCTEDLQSAITDFVGLRPSYLREDDSTAGVLLIKASRG